MRSARTMSARLTEAEAKVISEGAAALGISRSVLLAGAASIACHELGFFEDGRRNPQARGQAAEQWGLLPDGRFRAKEGQQVERGPQDSFIAFSVRALEFATIKDAAQWLGVPLSSFVVGAAMRFLARCKAEQPSNAKLAKISLPAPYEPRKKESRRR